MEGPDLLGAVLAVALVGLVAASRVRVAFPSWGGFAGSMPSASGSTADPSGIPDGMVPRSTTIEPSFPTTPEAAEGTNDGRPADPNPGASAS
jgi:hypothetical protein